jgi:hypothetical protein
MRLPSHETGFDLANSLHPARYRDNAAATTPDRDQAILQASMSAGPLHQLFQCFQLRRQPLRRQHRLW